MNKWQKGYGLFMLDGRTPLTPETLPLARTLIQREPVHNFEIDWLTVASPQQRGALVSIYQSPS